MNAEKVTEVLRGLAKALDKRLRTGVARLLGAWAVRLILPLIPKGCPRGMEDFLFELGGWQVMEIVTEVDEQETRGEDN